MKRISSVVVLFTFVFCFFVYTPQKVNSAIYNIKNGDLIRNSNAQGDAQFDIYIVKLINNKKFKRLILSPKVFLSYGHLDPNNVIEIDQSTMDIYTTSDLVRADGDPNIYKLYPQGDSGEKRWIKTIEKFNDLRYDWDSVYTINQTDRDEYISGSPIEDCINLQISQDTHEADFVLLKVACYFRVGDIDSILKYLVPDDKKENLISSFNSNQLIETADFFETAFLIEDYENLRLYKSWRDETEDSFSKFYTTEGVNGNWLIWKW